MRDLWLNPKALDLAISKSWYKQSKALDRSVKRTPHKPLPSRHFFHFQSKIVSNSRYSNSYGNCIDKWITKVRQTYLSDYIKVVQKSLKLQARYWLYDTLTFQVYRHFWRLEIHLWTSDFLEKCSLLSYC